MARMIRRVTVWQSDGDSHTARKSAQAISCKGGDEWRVRLPLSGVDHWPDDVEGWQLLMTDHDGDHFGGEVLSDDRQAAHRVVHIPRENESGTSLAATHISHRLP